MKGRLKSIEETLEVLLFAIREDKEALAKVLKVISQQHELKRIEEVLRALIVVIQDDRRLLKEILATLQPKTYPAPTGISVH